jgi:Fic family protein
MILDATGRYATPLTVERLFGWHAALLPAGRSGMKKIRTGAWRTVKSGPMQVVSGPVGHERAHCEAPGAALLPAEIKAIVRWFNSDQNIDPALKAGVVHRWFVTIHPFDDGNGRIARAIADIALARSEPSSQRFYSLSAQIRQDRNAYYDILEATQKGDLDITPWLTWCLDCLDRAFDRAENALESVLVKARFWKQQAGQAFTERQRAMIDRLLGGFEGKLTSSKWAQLAKC